MKDLKAAIEQKRREIEQLVVEKGMRSPEVLKVSNELDELLNKFNETLKGFSD